MEEKKEAMNCEDGVCETGVTDAGQNNIAIDKIEKSKLIYVGDPMCSWCWGIARDLDRIKNEYAESLDFEMIMGGLRPGGGEAWTEEFREMLKTHWTHVHEASGQPFDFAFFEKLDFNYDTEPPARAVRVVRDMAPDKEWSFYEAVQRAFYAENRDIHDLHVLEEICTELEIDFGQFQPLFLSQGYKQLVQQDFMKAQQLGIRGFPAVVLQKGEEYFAVTMGYGPYDRMKENINKILS